MKEAVSSGPTEFQRFRTLLQQAVSVPKSEIDKREVMNYYECLELIHQTAQSGKPITESLIKNIH